MDLTQERKAEIEGKVDDILRPYEANLNEFSLENIRKKLAGLTYNKRS